MAHRAPICIAPTFLRAAPRPPATWAPGSAASTQLAARPLHTSRTRRGPALPPSASSGPAAGDAMTWPEFLALRKRQRRYALFASVPTTLAGLTTGVTYFASKEVMPTATIMGIDPLAAYSIATIACVAAGWLVGPTLGSLLFRLRLSSAQRAAMQRKSAAFYEHVKRNRVDPSRQSVNNPVPDWFAEKVGSIKDYRRWLRDQAAYRRKATQHGMLVRKADMTNRRDLL